MNEPDYELEYYKDKFGTIEGATQAWLDRRMMSDEAKVFEYKFLSPTYLLLCVYRKLDE